MTTISRFHFDLETGDTFVSSLHNQVMLRLLLMHESESRWYLAGAGGGG